MKRVEIIEEQNQKLIGIRNLKYRNPGIENFDGV